MPDSATIEDPFGISDASDAVLELLRARGLVGLGDIDQAMSVAGNRRRALPLVLNQLGIVKDDDLASAYSVITGLPVSTGAAQTRRLCTPRMNPEFLRSRQAFIPEGEDVLLLVDPTDEKVAAAVRFALGILPPQAIAPARDLAQLVNESVNPAAAPDLLSRNRTHSLRISSPTNGMRQLSAKLPAGLQMRLIAGRPTSTLNRGGARSMSSSGWMATFGLSCRNPVRLQAL